MRGAGAPPAWNDSPVSRSLDIPVIATETSTAALPTTADPSLARYARQTILPQIGRDGQRRLAEAHVLVVGCGALGGASANLLARAGIGRLSLVDRDYVELHNLQRQTLYDEADVASHLPKAVAAAEKLRRANGQIAVEPIVADVDAASIERLLKGVDVAVDGLDNFETRYLLNDAAVKHGVPWVYGGVIGTYGLTMTIRPGATACLRCVFPEPPPAGSAPTCDTAGVLGPAVDLVAAVQAAEALKVAVGAEERLNDGLLALDPWQLTFERVPLPGPVADCPTCGARRFRFLERPAAARTSVLCGHEAVQIRPWPATTHDLTALGERLATAGETLANPFLVRFRPAGEPYELTIFPDGRTIVKGATDPSEARAVYARFVGT
jgi:adenylyltransferase/sulfurtransferase